MMSDHYQALGIQPGASRQEIRAAYLRLMRSTHPDIRPGDRGAAERARRANAAWEVLGDSARRAAYDRLRRQPDGIDVVHIASPPGGRDHVAYSPARRAYQRAFHLATLRVGMAVVAIGCALLLLLTR